MYYIDTLKRELIDTNAYKLQASLSERVVVDEHGCHTTLHVGVKAKVNQDRVSKVLTSCLTAVKNMLLSTVQRYMKNPVRIFFGLLKIQVKF